MAMPKMPATFTRYRAYIEIEDCSDSKKRELIRAIVEAVEKVSTIQVKNIFLSKMTQLKKQEPDEIITLIDLFKKYGMDFAKREEHPARPCYAGDCWQCPYPCEASGLKRRGL